MVFNQKFLASTLALLVLAGCSSSDDKSKRDSSSSSGGFSSPGSSSSSSSSGGATKGAVTCSGNVCQISGAITDDMTLTADNTYVLNGFVRVGDGNRMVADESAVDAVKAAGVTLTIEKGTHVRVANDGILLVTRGSKIMAEGTADMPITFSSAEDEDFDGEGEWGGIVIQGFAPQYGAGDTGVCFGTGAVCNVNGEGGDNIGFYAGNDPADNSGSLKYVRIAEGGLVAGPNNEINGLTLQGVGHGTTIEYIQVHGNLDDGIEWFGGTVNVKHAVLTNNDDDDIDFDEGYRGNIQHVIVRKNPDKTIPTGSNDPRGIEANSSVPDQVSATEAVLANVTIIGSDLVVSGKAEPGMRLRGDVNASIWNSAVSGFNDCVRIDSESISLANFLGACAEGYIDDRVAGGAKLNRTNDQELTGMTLGFDAFGALTNPEAVLAAPTTGIVVVDNGSAFEFDETAYIGAVDPDSANTARQWWADWTIPGSLDGLATPSDAPSFVSCADDVCTLSGNIDSHYTLTPGVNWILDGFTTVGAGNVSVADDAAVAAIKDAGVHLYVQPGVHVQSLDDGVLLVTRGSKIYAVGTRQNPITFSSAIDVDYDGEGEWGGIVIQGFAPQYGAGDTGACFGTGTVCNVNGEGGDNIGFYAGNDPADSSGALKYVRIAEGGLVAGPNNEINGLTLQGVGHGTMLDYIQVHNNLDDGIEWFGGTANLTHAVLTNNDDDDVDFDEGYKGNMQFILVRKNPTKAAPTGSNDPRGVEANSSSPDQVSATEAVISNLTIIGSELVVTGKAEPGMRLRGDVKTKIWNSAVSNYNDCYRIDSGGNVLANFIGSCVSGFEDDHTAGASITKTNVNEISGGSLMFDSLWAVTNSEAVLNSAPDMIAPVDNGSGFDFVETNFMGAVNPDAMAVDRDWWADWTIPGSLSQ